MPEFDAEHLLDLLLQYEALRHNQKITYYQRDLSEYEPSEADNNQLSVISHSSETKEKFSIPFNQAEISFETSHFCAPGEPVVYKGKPLASTQGADLLIHFDPDDFLKAVPEPGVFNEVMGAILSTGIGRIIEEKRLKDDLNLQIWLESQTKSQNFKIHETQNQIDDIKTEIDELRSKLWHAHRKLQEYSELLIYRKKFTDMAWQRKMEADYREILKLVPATYASIEFGEKAIIAMTHMIVIDYDGYDYDIGKFKVTVNLEGSYISFSNLTLRIDSHDHPHVQESRACWGNLEETAARMLAQEDCYGLLVLADEFLHSYNPLNPYMKIERWDPEYCDEDDDHERYESCYESSGYTDCVRCSDDGCSYHDGAESRCRENSDYPDDCLSCRISSCSSHDDAINECQQDRQECPEKCVQCEARGCDFAGNEEMCLESHQGSRCPVCSLDYCSIRPTKEEVA